MSDARAEREKTVKQRYTELSGHEEKHPEPVVAAILAVGQAVDYHLNMIRAELEVLSAGQKRT